MNKLQTNDKNKVAIAPATAVYSDVQRMIVSVRNQQVILDADVARLYGVETKRINEAVRNNPDKFPADYMFELTTDESIVLRSKISSLEQGGKGRHSKYNYKAFTEKGLYMLATVLKSRRATEATFAIIETFAKVRCLKRELVELHTEADKQKRADSSGQVSVVSGQYAVSRQQLAVAKPLTTDSWPLTPNCPLPPALRYPLDAVHEVLVQYATTKAERPGSPRRGESSSP